MVDMNDAVQVIRDVLERYENDLPAGLASKVKSVNPAKIFFILSENNYAPHFDAYFRAWFAVTNVIACARPNEAAPTERIIGIAKGAANAYSKFACPAFVAPAVDPLNRRIYVNAESGVTIGTLYHEFIHFLSHGSFYPEFYALGGRNPIILEGVTEFLTRNIAPGIYRDRASQGKYDSQLLDVLMHAGGGGERTVGMLTGLAFKGDLSVIKTLDGAVPHL